MNPCENREALTKAETLSANWSFSFINCLKQNIINMVKENYHRPEKIFKIEADFMNWTYLKNSYSRNNPGGPGGPRGPDGPLLSDSSVQYWWIDKHLSRSSFIWNWRNAKALRNLSKPKVQCIWPLSMHFWELWVIISDKMKKSHVGIINKLYI